MNVPRSAALVAAVLALGAAASPAVAAPSPSPSAIPGKAEGLFGEQDPTYDGVWRQSLALTALATAKAEVPRPAVDWLVGQQCADGAFAAFRAKPGADCGPKDKVDSNSTAAAVQALVAVGGHRAEAEKSLDWLKSTQNADGGWSYNPGGASDANSTSVVAGALTAMGEEPGSVTSKKGASPFDALRALALKCGSGSGEGAAFAYQPDPKSKKLVANDDATAAAVTAALGHGFVVSGPGEAGAGGKYACHPPENAREAARNGAAHLAAAVAKNGHLMSAMPGAKDQPDVGNTADTVVALTAAGLTGQARKPLAWLEENGAEWAGQTGPAAWAQLVLTARATGTDVHDFGGTDLVAKLAAQGPADASAAPAPGAKDEKQDGGGDKDGGISPWWMVGVGAFVGIGIGFLVSGRHKRSGR
ncbi:prenyltransferase/squalene oxidase repeat-containing protein [Streptomyces sp. NPDC007088]|uniref:prenyltransferase/squalene oxidase repeat-containing protein n=1 Tax=Streptomyces sp. NPDC007088 TaxID=3364773 RepID=UPI00369FDDE7